EAVRNAAVARFRPVLMTSLSTILGTLPLALALGAGSESRASMGIAVIGGLLLGSALTLYVVPAVYSWVTGKMPVPAEEPVAPQTRPVRPVAAGTEPLGGATRS
ncbi:MAG: efflux RND transporter permease subunit, partial [Acidobacteria bacterium]|nr:efflux RND transporter permease subunit [Acidobacteriota bacterium]